MKPFAMCALAALCLAARAQEPPKPPAVPHDALRVLDLWFEAQHAHERLPAISAGVVLGQQLVWKKGYGHIDAAQRVPAGPDTLYSICSISKLFTAVATMQQWEAGKLSLDDDVSRWVSSFNIRRSDPDSGPISIRSLLMHSSGLPREADLPYWASSQFPNRDALYASARTQSTFARANERYQYSNLGLAVLGDVVATAAGQPYAQVVQQQVLQPLGMADTRLGLPLDLLGTRLAEGFGAPRRDGSRERLAPFDTLALGAAAGYVSSVEDLARFAQWQLRLLQKGGTELLKASTLREMQRVQWQDAAGKNTRGLGFSVVREGTTTVVGHDGLCPGYRTAMAVLPREQLAVIGMTNALGSATAPFTRAMRQVLLKGLRLPAPKDKAMLQAYAGRYDTQPFGSELVVVPWGDGLAMLSLPTPDPAAALGVLKHERADTFRVQREDGSLGTPVYFERNSDGQVVGFRVNGQPTPKAGPL